MSRLSHTRRSAEILTKRVGSEVKINAPAVSVIIPVYNYAEFIAEALDSVFSQTFNSFEVILVNDGSDDSDLLEEALAPFFSKIVYIARENGGTAAARNTAIENARGKWLAFLDSDDIWLADYLREQISELEKRQCDMIYSDAILFGPLIDKFETFMTRCPSHGAVTPESLLSGRSNVINSGTVARRETVLKVGLLDADLPQACIEDFDLWFRIAKSHSTIEYQQKALLKYRVHEKSLSGNAVQRAARTVSAYEAIQSKYELTESEKMTLAKRLASSRAELQLEKGKFNLFHQNFSLARQNFREANEHFKKFKYSAIIGFLALAPRLLLRLFTLLRRSDAALMYSDETSLETSVKRNEIRSPAYRGE